jgi:hypothetical protein
MLEIPVGGRERAARRTSTGMPTMTEQADLWQAIHGRNGEAPIPVIAASSTHRLLRHGLRGRADRRRAHDTGDPAHRWIHRQRFRAMALPEAKDLPEIKPPSPHPRGTERRAQPKAGC